MSYQLVMGAGRSRYWALAIILLAGCALRLVAINKWPLWGDEALTLVISTWPTETLFFKSVDPTPGLYYAVQKFALGSSAFEARFASVIFGTGTIAATYAMARRANAPPTLAAALLALSFPLIDYSQEARAYALLILLTSLSAASFMEWERSNQRFPLAAFIGFNVLALYTHPIALFWVTPASAAMLLIAERAIRRDVIIGLCGQIILFAPELARLKGYSSDGFAWLKHADPAVVLGTLGYAFLPLGITEATLDAPVSILAAAFGFAVLVWRIWAHWNGLSVWYQANRGAGLAVLILVTSPMALWIVGFAKPIFMPRTTLIAVPAFLVGLTVLLSFEKRIVSYVVLGLYAAALSSTGTVRDKYEWRKVAEKLQRQVRPGDVILVCPAWETPALRAALMKPLPAPLYGKAEDRFMLMESRVGWDTNWVENYRKMLASGVASVPLRGSRTWNVTSECR